MKVRQRAGGASPLSPVSKSRLVPSDREYSVGDKGGTQRLKAYETPLLGLSLASPRAGSPAGTALIMDNIIPTTSGCKVRAGYEPVGHSFTQDANGVSTVDLGLKRMFGYTAANGAHALFAASSTTVYKFTDSTSNLSMLGVITGQNSADYSVLQNQTSGGRYLTICNGVDNPRIYNGTSWSTISQWTQDVSDPADVAPGANEIGGVDPSTFSYVWAYNNRQYFIQVDSLKVWYLGVNSITGAAAQLNLESVFSRSSSLLFGTTFSYDSGAGIDDYNVFVSAEGEVALYQGTDPSGSDWSFKGLFTLATPLGKNAHFNVAGDLVIATRDGLTPLSAALKKDISELSLHSLSRNIDPALRDEIMLSAGVNDAMWNLEKSDFHGLGFVKLPRRNQTDAHMYVVNMETGAWCRFTNFLAEDVLAIGSEVYFCHTGKVLKAFSSGRDDGSPIQCRLVNSFDDFQADGLLKKIHKVKANFTVRGDAFANISVETDYEITDPIYPQASSAIIAGAAKYDTAIYGVAKWAGKAPIKPYTRTKTLHKRCNSAAIQITVSSDNPDPMDIELASMSLSYTQGQHF